MIYVETPANPTLKMTDIAACAEIESLLAALNEPLPEGPAKGRVVDLDVMLPRFYQVRGWDENGVPPPEKLKSLGLA